MTTKATILPLKLICRTFVSLPGITLAGLDNLTPEEISAIGARVPDDDWEVVSVERKGGFEIDLATYEDADLLLSVTLTPPARPTIGARAQEIGVSENTLFRWKREGVDVFDDDQVRSKIGRSRKHLWHANPKFKGQPKSD